jgi:hypothetical protein
MDEPDALFRDHLTEEDIRWNRFPKWTAYSDVARQERHCGTAELLCLEFPFPLVIPRALDAPGQQATGAGRVSFVATAGRTDRKSVCDVSYFTVVTQLEGQDYSYHFDFSRAKGLARVTIVRHGLGQVSIVAVYDLVAGRIYDHDDLCGRP